VNSITSTVTNSRGIQANHITWQRNISLLLWPSDSNARYTFGTNDEGGAYGNVIVIFRGDIESIAKEESKNLKYIISCVIRGKKGYRIQAILSCDSVQIDPLDNEQINYIDYFSLF